MPAGYAYALTLTLFAGLSTGIGGLIVLKVDRTNTKLLSAALGFSAGVMVYVSFMELLPEGLSFLLSSNSETRAQWLMLAAFFVGIVFIALIDRFVPEAENPHEPLELEQIEDVQQSESESNESDVSDLNHHQKRELKRMGLFSAFAIAIHNFPEGIATFISALVDPTLGLSIAIAVAIHNIPEGIGVAVPIYYATGSKRKGFLYALLSGLAEPAGALAAALILQPFLTDQLLGLIFCMVAGIMVFISFDELLPTAEKYGEHHVAIYGVVAGMMMMSITLIVF